MTGDASQTLLLNLMKQLEKTEGERCCEQGSKHTLHSLMHIPRNAPGACEGRTAEYYRAGPRRHENQHLETDTC